jgi:hypothetical protein
MNASVLAVLSDAERLLVAQTEPTELAALDEDAAIEFEARSGARATSTSASTAGAPAPRCPNRAGAARRARRTRGPP